MSKMWGLNKKQLYGRSSIGPLIRIRWWRRRRNGWV